MQLKLFGKQVVQPARTVINLQKEIIAGDIGKIVLVRKPGVRRISISIRPFTGVRVLLPMQVDFSQAEKFVHLKAAWIKKNLEKTEKAESGMTVFDHSVNFSTCSHRLEIHPRNGNVITARITPGIIEVMYPFELDVKDNRVQKIVRSAIENAWRIEAREYLPSRVKELAAMHGFSYQSVSVKNARTRWGSCSSRNNLNFSLHLMRLPPHLTDYIILHELTHTVHKNHSSNFWEHLHKVSGNAKSLDNEMNNYRIGIY